MGNDRLNEIAGKMHSERARIEFLNFVNGLNSIRDEKSSISLGDDIDGVAAMLASDAAEMQRQKLEDLQSRQKHFFGLEENSTRLVPEPILAGGSINDKGKWGYTQLHFAVMNRDVEEVRNLLALGADSTIPDNSGQSPYDKAQMGEYTEILELF